jgi:hypothetical protein
MGHRLYITLCLLILTLSPAFALNKVGRMGVGMSNQLINEIPALSVKIQQNRQYALGALLGFRSGDDDTLYGAGLRLYRVIYEEPLLNFYMAASLISLNFQEQDKTKSGYQVDGTFGSEFHFDGLESIGFSFEFGLSLNRGPNGSSFETLGQNFLKAAIHFYL